MPRFSRGPSGPRSLGLRSYSLSCGLLLLPIFLGNLAFAPFLPSRLSMKEFWRDIPSSLGFLENALRAAVSILPFVMPLELKSVGQRRGLLVYGIGAAFYFCAWAAVILAPNSTWSAGPAGFLAPAYTPLIWLVGIAMLGQRLYWGRWYRWWMFLVPTAGFVAAHVSHTWLVYARTR